jgi:hypothetical protein
MMLKIIFIATITFVDAEGIGHRWHIANSMADCRAYLLEQSEKVHTIGFDKRIPISAAFSCEKRLARKDKPINLGGVMLTHWWIGLDTFHYQTK